MTETETEQTVSWEKIKRKESWACVDLFMKSNESSYKLGLECSVPLLLLYRFY